MIRSFRQKALAALYMKDDPHGLPPDLVERCRRRLAVMRNANRLEDMNIPGLGLHRLRGRPRRHAISVNGPWRITFEWHDGEAWRVDLEQYH